MTDKLFRKFDTLLNNASNLYDGEHLYLMRYVYSKGHTDIALRRHFISKLNFHSSSQLDAMDQYQINELYNKIIFNHSLYDSLRTSSIGGIRYLLNEADGIHSLFLEELKLLKLPLDPALLVDVRIPVASLFIQLCDIITTLKERLQVLIDHPSSVTIPTLSPSVHHL